MHSFLKTDTLRLLLEELETGILFQSCLRCLMGVSENAPAYVGLVPAVDSSSREPPAFMSVGFGTLQVLFWGIYVRGCRVWKLKNWVYSRYFPSSAFSRDIDAVFSFVGVEIPSVWGFFPPKMTRAISTLRLNCSGIKFQVEQHGSYFIISEFIPELGTNVFKFHFLV